MKGRAELDKKRGEVEELDATDALRRVRAGQMTQEEFISLVNQGYWDREELRRVMQAEGVPEDLENLLRFLFDLEVPDWIPQRSAPEYRLKCQ